MILLTTVSSNSMGSTILIPFLLIAFGAEFLIVLIGHNSRLVVGHISWPVIGHNRWPVSDEQCNFDPLLYCTEKWCSLLGMFMPTQTVYLKTTHLPEVILVTIALEKP